MKIALAQINTTVGDFEGNGRKAAEAAHAARDRGADLVVLPEMTLCGYPPRDLLLMDWFITAGRRALERLAREVPPEVGVIAGFPEPNDAPDSRGLFNAAALIADGRIATVRRKTLLPTYGVFDEDRYFDAAAENTPIEWRGRRIGLTICEDAWNDAGFWPRRRYACDPVERLVAAGADMLINVSASPFTLGKRRERHAMFAAMARRHGIPVVNVNLIGGNDDVIFDGGSAAFAPDGQRIANARELDEDLALADIGAMTGEARPLIEDDSTRLAAALERGVADYIAKCGFHQVIIGLSGGIDSAVTAAVAARALGPERVTGVGMPSRHSSEGSLTDAAALAGNLGIKFFTIPIEPMHAAFRGALEPHWNGCAAGLADENIQARVRGATLMALANQSGAIVLTTGNKSEVATGYCTLYGDMAGGLAVLADVTKTQVYELARHYNRAGEVIPAATLTKPPSAELRPDQKDSDSLPEYDALDPILREHVEDGRGEAKLTAAGHDAEAARRVLRLIHGSEFKRRQAAPGLKVSARAFGGDWRMPVAKKLNWDVRTD